MAHTQKEDNRAQIIIRRSGLINAPQTLEEIGRDYKITRERIRQIEQKHIELSKLSPTGLPQT